MRLTIKLVYTVL